MIITRKLLLNVHLFAYSIKFVSQVVSFSILIRQFLPYSPALTKKR